MVEPVTAAGIGGAAAKPLVAALMKPVTGAAFDAVLGSKDRRAIEKAIGRAVDRAEGDFRGDGASAEVASDLFDRVTRLVASYGPDDFTGTLRDPDPTIDRLVWWQEAAEASGWDLETLPLPMEAILTRTLANLAEELQEAAAKPDSPVFNRLVLEQVGAMYESFQLFVAQAHAASVVTIPLSGQLLRSLMFVKDAAAEQDQAVYTAHTLLAFLRSPTSTVVRCLEDVRPGLGKQILGQLEAFVGGDGLGTFEDFDWSERTEVRGAQRLALMDGSLMVNECHLMLAILEAESKTARELRRLLGKDKVDLVEGLRLSSRRSRPETPGVVFGSPVGSG